MCQIKLLGFGISETMKLIGEGEYNLNVLKEIVVTNSFLGLDENVRGCQNEEPLDNCTTRHYMESLSKNCGCLPISIRLSDEVAVFILLLPNA